MGRGDSEECFGQDPEEGIEGGGGEGEGWGGGEVVGSIRHLSYVFFLSRVRCYLMSLGSQAKRARKTVDISFNSL